MNHIKSSAKCGVSLGGVGELSLKLPVTPEDSLQLELREATCEASARMTAAARSTDTLSVWGHALLVGRAARSSAPSRHLLLLSRGPREHCDHSCGVPPWLGEPHISAHSHASAGVLKFQTLPLLSIRNLAGYIMEY